MLHVLSHRKVLRKLGDDRKVLEHCFSEKSSESPHFFNAYILPLKGQLESEHPRLCKLFDVIIAVILYADNAALPADSPEDLQLSVSIFEQFCNDNRLLISVPKTFLMAFHAKADGGVAYQNGNVLWMV